MALIFAAIKKVLSRKNLSNEMAGFFMVNLFSSMGVYMSINALGRR